MYLDFATSKRKIIGVYEYVLNEWIESKVSLHSNYIDVGANNGYHTYGFAHAAKRAGRKNIHVTAIEPSHDDQLAAPRDWPEYKDVTIDIIAKYCSSSRSHDHVRLVDLVQGLPEALIKVDIEGAEADVIPDVGQLVGDERFSWCIEVHGEALIPVVAAPFCAAGRPFLIKDQKPLPLLGPERRPIATTWLVTI